MRSTLALSLCVPLLACDPATVEPPDAGADPCAAFTCSGHGSCVLDQGKPRCDCDLGYEDDGAAGCTPDDPCQPNPCSGANRTVCRARGRIATCSCDPGLRDDGAGHCVDACTPNPCTTLHRSVCSASAQGFSCGCDTAFEDDGAGGCSFVLPATCPAAHGSGDRLEPDECLSLARPLAVPAAEVRTIEPAGDLDWLFLDAREGTGYALKALSDEVALTLTLRDPDGAPLVSRSGQAAQFIATPGPGRFFVTVAAEDGRSTGAYTLELVEVPDDVGNLGAKAALLSFEQPTQGTIDYLEDEDWYSFPAKADHDYVVMLTSVKGEIWDADGLGDPATAPRRVFYNNPAILQPAVDTTYYLRVYAGSKAPQTYSISVTDTGLDDHGDTLGTATPIDASVNGVVNSWWDTDCFRVEVEPGRVFRATLRADSIFLSFQPLAGDPLAPWVSRPPEILGKGPGHLSVGGGSAVLVPYTLEFELLGLDDHGDTPQTATPITPGTRVKGQFDSQSDRDCVSVPTVPDQPYEILFEGPPYVTREVLDSRGVLVGSETFVAADSGPYALCLGPSKVGAYTLEVKPRASDDHGCRPGTATSISPGTTVVGAIDYPYDVDLFVFDATAGHLYTNGAAWRVFDSTATLDASTGVFWAPRTGKVYLEVTRKLPGPYLLTFADLGPEDHGEDASTATPLPLGTAVDGVLSWSGDADWFRSPTTPGRIQRLTVKPVGFTVRARHLGSDGKTVIYDQYAYSPLTFTFKAPASFHHLQVSPYFATGTGHYTVLAEDLGADDVGDTSDEATPLVVGSAATTGAIQFHGDVDVFSFAATASALALKVTATGIAGSITVTDALGATVASGVGPGTLALNLPGAGTYFVQFASGREGTYSIGVGP